MKLNDDLPRWISWPVRVAFYALVLFILFNLANGVVQGRVASNTMECSAMVSASKGMEYARAMVTCLRQKNGVLGNMAMRPVYHAIDAMPSNPGEFVGTWNSSQPRCNYRFTLQANGEFVGEPMGCTLSAETFHGAWGVYDRQMVWLYDEGNVWPPDINPMDVVDKDFFLLVEKDGSRTRFTRAEADVAKGALPVRTEPGSPDWAVSRGYEWARDNGIRSHAACRSQWTEDRHEHLERSGCSKYVTEVNVVNVVKPIPQHNGWDDGTTTAQCIADVHAYWDPIVADLYEQGEDHVAQSRTSRDLGPALRECQNFDNLRIGRVIHQPQLRLDAILARVKGGAPISQQDKEIVQQDYPGVQDFPENEYRSRYLSTADELFHLVGGREQVFAVNVSLDGLGAGAIDAR